MGAESAICTGRHPIEWTAMSHFQSAALSRLGGWGEAYAEAAAAAEADYASAHSRPVVNLPQSSTEAQWESERLKRLREDAWLRVFTLKMLDPQAFELISRELPLAALLQRRLYLHDPADFLSRLAVAEETAPRLPPEQALINQDVVVTGERRRPSEPIPVDYGSRGEMTEQQGATFARLCEQEDMVEQMLLDTISLQYLNNAEQWGAELFARRLGEAPYLPDDLNEDTFRRLLLVRELQLAPSVPRLAVVYEAPYYLDPEHGELWVALIDEFEYVSLGGVDSLVWLV
jgi:hypothetical protein